MSDPPTKAIPCEDGGGVLGNLPSLMRAPHLYPAELGWRHNGVAAFRALHKRFIAVTDSALIRHILVTAADIYPRSYQFRNAQTLLGKGLLSTEGSFWQSRRRQMQPAFGTDLLRHVTGSVCQVTRLMFERWEAERKAGRPVKAVQATRRLTMAIIVKVLFSAQLDDEQADRLSLLVTQGLQLLMRRNVSLWAPPLWLPFPQNRALLRIRREIEAFVGEHIERRRTGVPTGDMLDILLALRDPDSGEALPAQALMDEAKTLFGAGFETTATALSWALHLVAGHPEIAASLHAEVDSVLGGREPSYEDLARLPVTLSVVNETLRLFPPVYTSPRQCVKTDRWNGMTIPRGATMLLSIYGLHRDPANWPDPDNFVPSRFGPGQVWSKQSFLPFGAGRHTCIGNAFAVTEMQIVLALIAQRYHLQPADPTPVGMQARLVLTPNREIPITLVPRS